MRRFHVRFTALVVGMAAAGLAIGWLADDLRPADLIQKTAAQAVE